MFDVANICGAMILTPDAVRMNSAREQIIRDFVAGPQGVNCKAVIDTTVSGELLSVDLFGGDDLQRNVFKQTLTHVVLG